MDIPPVSERLRLRCDVAVVGGGTAGTMAAITAAEHGASVLLLDKAHVRHSGALAMGMDGVNNAVIPGKATPEDYVAEITRANDGIVNQAAIYQTASRGFAMVQRLERYGVKFDKDAAGDFHVRRVHRSGSYVLPMPEGKDVKKVLYRVLRQRHMRERVRIENRVMPVRVLTSPDGRATGLAGLHTRTGEFVTVSAGAVILATGACGRLGLPASGYLYGTYENPTNAGDGHAMAFHAGAELSGLECFQVNPLIKDYNGPACAYVANPFGGYQVNSAGERFVDCDYWSGQMMAEVAREIASARGPIYLKLTHLPDETLDVLESILHTTERPTRGTFHAGRGHSYRTHDVEMHISEIGLCGGHSASGVWVDEHARTTVPGLYAAGDLACVPHNYMIGAFVFGDLAGADASAAAAGAAATGSGPDEEQVAAAHELIYRPLRHPDGPPQQQVEYKLRRFVNDYVAPPKSAAKLAIAVETFERMAGEIELMGASTPHELMRCAEVSFIRDCAELAARASLTRTESRWGLYHDRADLPDRDDAGWFCHLNVRRGPEGGMQFVRRPVAEYLVPVPEFAGLAEAAGIPPEGVAVLAGGAGGAGAADRASGSPGPGGARGSGGALSSGRGASGADGADDPGGAGGSDGAGGARGRAVGRSPRILELLQLAERQPSLAQVRPYLADPDPQVRRAAIAVLTEAVPPGTGLALADAAGDERGTVRHAAVTGLRELVEVLPADGGLRDRLAAAALGSTDAVVRAAVLDVLRQLRLGDRGLFAARLSDGDHRVRLQAVRGLVSLGELRTVTSAAGDPAREVRIAVAAGLAEIGDVATRPAEVADAATGPAEIGSVGAGSVLARLAGDDDPLVRAAALSSAGQLGCPDPLLGPALAALAGDPAWQVRVGAAQALQGAAVSHLAGPAADDVTDDVTDVIAAALAAAGADPHADVRKAAVIALGPLSRHPAAPDALEAALGDSDADVRGYARRALAGAAAKG